MTEQKVKFFEKINNIRELVKKIADKATNENNATRVAFQVWSSVHGDEKKTAIYKSKLVNRLHRLDIDRETIIKARWRAYDVEKKARENYMLNNTLVKTTEEKANAWKEIADAIIDVFFKIVDASLLSPKLLFNESNEVGDLSEADDLAETAFKNMVLNLLEKVKIIKRNATVEMKTAINDNETTKRFLNAKKAAYINTLKELRASKDAMILNALLNALSNVNKDELEKTRPCDIYKKKLDTIYNELNDIIKMSDASEAKQKTKEATAIAWEAVLNGVSDVLSKIIKTEVISLTAKKAATEIAILNASTKTYAAEKIARLTKVYTTEEILANAEKLSKLEALIKTGSSIEEITVKKATVEAKELKLCNYWDAPTWKEWLDKEEKVYLNAYLIVEKLLDSESDALFKAKQLIKAETTAEGEKIIELWGLGIDMDWDEVMYTYYNIYASIVVLD